MRIITNVAYNLEHDACKLDLYLPDRCVDRTPIFVSIHGGGLEEGDKGGEGRKRLAQTLTEQGVAMASVNYRMYPAARYPDYIKDVAAAVSYLLHGCYDFGKVAIGGESAGGYITQMLYFNKTFLQEAGVDRSCVKGFVMDAGQPTTHFNILKYERGIDGRAVVIDEAAALYYLRKQYEKAEDEPYVAIFAADRDMVNRLEQNVMLKTAMLHFGFPEEKLLFHVFEGFAHCGYCDQPVYIDKVTDFLLRAFAQ